MPRFLISSAGGPPQTFELAVGDHMIGRDDASQIFLANVSVSREHARVTVGPTQVSIEDLGSGNGTTVNGATLLQGFLKSKDELKIGKFSLVFLDDSKVDEFYGGRCVRYLPRYEPRGAAVGEDETFMLSKEALKAMVGQSRLLGQARLVQIRNPSRFWHPEGRALTFGNSAAMVQVEGWFIFGTVAKVTWDGTRHWLQKESWWVSVKVNDVAVDRAALKHNDCVTIGDDRFRYEGERA